MHYTIKSKILKSLLVQVVIITFLLCIPQFSSSQGTLPRQEAKIDNAIAQYNLNGQGVVVVMIDRGIDYTHPDFIDDAGNTRIAYLYDMTDDSGMNAANNTWGVGTVWNAADINAAIGTGIPNVGKDRGGHGTATTGIICGNGSGTVNREYKGVAPNATIISIELTNDGFPAFGNQAGQVGFFNPNYIPIALDFARAKIAELGLPSVTLMNIGSISYSTDGTSLICRKIDEFVDAGNPFVLGVGDDGGAANHASGIVAQGQTVELEIEKVVAGNLRFDMWYSEDDRYSISIKRPNNTIEGPFSAPNSASGFDDRTLNDIQYAHRGANVEFAQALSNRREVLIDLTGALGIYKIIITGTQVNSEEPFHAMLNPSHYSSPNKFKTFVSPMGSINDYATSFKGITPTDYVVKNEWIDINGIPRDITGQGEDGEIWIGSSEGPTHDGRIGVDFAVPGEVCFGAYSPNTYYSNFSSNMVQNSNGLYGVQNAVSAAAPIATGIIALMLQRNPALTPLQIKTILQQSCIQDTNTGAVPNFTWGYGKLDALKAIQSVFSFDCLPNLLLADMNNGNSLDPQQLTNYKTDGTITSTQSIINPAMVLYQSPIGIFFQPGFETKNMAGLEVKIGGCP